MFKHRSPSLLGLRIIHLLNFHQVTDVGTLQMDTDLVILFSSWTVWYYKIGFVCSACCHHHWRMPESLGHGASCTPSMRLTPASPKCRLWDTMRNWWGQALGFRQPVGRKVGGRLLQKSWVSSSSSSVKMEFIWHVFSFFPSAFFPSPNIGTLASLQPIFCCQTFCVKMWSLARS